MVSEEKMFENVDGRTDGRTTDGRTTDGRTTDAGVTGILIAHLGAFGSGELKSSDNVFFFFFFSPQLILHKSNGEFKRKLSFSRFQRGSNIFQGGPTFSRGGGGPIAYFL